MITIEDVEELELETEENKIEIKILSYLNSIGIRRVFPSEK